MQLHALIIVTRLRATGQKRIDVGDATVPGVWPKRLIKPCIIFPRWPVLDQTGEDLRLKAN